MTLVSPGFPRLTWSYPTFGPKPKPVSISGLDPDVSIPPRWADGMAPCRGSVSTKIVNTLYVIGRLRPQRKFRKSVSLSVVVSYSRLNIYKVVPVILEY